MRAIAIAAAVTAVVGSSLTVHGQTTPANGENVKITSGLVEFQVLQRNAQGYGSAALAGTVLQKFNSRYIEGRVLDKDGKEIAGTSAAVLGQVKAGKWSGPLNNIPTGGPYLIEARVSGMPATAAAIPNILVGDLWVLAGQSNMEGVGDLIDTPPPIPEVHSFDQSDVWGIARDPLHNLRAAIDPVHWPKNKQGVSERPTADQVDLYNKNRKKGAGPGLPFAVEMFRRTGIPVGLVPCAHGGTSMDEWSPSLKDQNGKSLYGATLRRIQAVGGKVKGILWYQGEADANAERAPSFKSKFESLIVAFRSDLAQPELPFYYVQIGLHVSNGPQAEWNAVQEAQRLVESAIPNAGMVSAVDVALDDQIHVSTQDQRRIGRRLASLAAHDLYPTSTKENAALKRGPRPVSAKYEKGVIMVTFSEVNDRLEADGRIAGFVVLNAERQPIPAIYKAKFDSVEGSVLFLHVAGDLPTGATLKYGLGRNPYCNVRDNLDMGLPAFGPIPIEGIQAPPKP